MDPLDTLGRPLHDLRISVTDRCNFRCVYCMPTEVFGKDFQFLPRAEILTFEEIERLAQIFVSLGVQKIRLTGGEPLVRRNLEVLVEKLAKIGDLDLTLTTNGSLLSQKARTLADAGLRRVTVSLDSLDDATFKRMNDSDFPVAKVLAGIEAAKDAGLAPIKVNMVTKRGVNESSIVPMARYFKGTGTAAARSVLSRRSRSRSAPIARGHDCQPTGLCTRASSPRRGTVCVRSSEAAGRTR